MLKIDIENRPSSGAHSKQSTSIASSIPLFALGPRVQVNRTTLARRSRQAWETYQNHLKQSKKQFDLKFLKFLLGLPNHLQVAPQFYYSANLAAAFELLSNSDRAHATSNSNCLIFAKHLVSNFENVRCVLQKLPPDPFEVLSKKRHLSLEKQKRPLLLLDLDETLIHTNDKNIESFDLRTRIGEISDQQIELGVNFRPFVLQFLYLAREMFDLGIFTASTREYAEPMLLLLDPRRELFKVRLFREDCICMTEALFLKELRIIGNRHAGDVFIVDNNSHFFANNLDNGIPIVPFTNDPHDRELPHLLFFLVYLLSVPTRELRRASIRSQFKSFLFTQECSLSDFLGLVV